MPSEHAVQLSSAQKRDLLGMSAAAVITTVLIAAPILLPHDTGVTPLVDPSVISASAVPTPLLIQTISPSTFEVPAARAHFRLKAEATRTEDTLAPARRHERAPLAPLPVRLESRPIAMSAPMLVAVATTGTRPSKPLGKRIAGLFTGDGTYSVRPFPTIASERQ